MLKSALILLTMFSSSQMPRPPCRPYSKQEYWPWPILCSCHPLQKLCNPPAVDSLPLQCAWQWGCWLSGKVTQDKSKWTGLPATLRWRPSSRPRNTASGGMSTSATKRVDSYLLTRWEQVSVYRFGTGNKCRNHHLYSQLSISETEQCPCNTGSQTTEHLQQFCPLYEPLRKATLQTHDAVLWVHPPQSLLAEGIFLLKLT